MSRRVDPFTIEVIRNAVTAIAEDRPTPIAALLWWSQVALNVHTPVKNTHHVDSDINSQIKNQMFASRVDAQTFVNIGSRLA